MCADSWIGSDVSIPVTVRITEMSRSDKEGRTHRGKPLPVDQEEEGSAGMNMHVVPSPGISSSAVCFFCGIGLFFCGGYLKTLTGIAFLTICFQGHIGCSMCIASQ